MYEIYVDILICTNIFISYFILLAIARFFSISFKRFRLVLASLLGGIFSLLIFVPESFTVLNLVLKFLISIVITLVAFKVTSFLNFLKIVSCFHVMNFLFAGVILFLWYFLKCENIVIRNNTVYFDISPIFFMVSTFFTYIIIRFLSFFLGAREFSSDFCNLKIEQEGKIFSLRAKIDTANTLKDPFSNKPVVIVEYKFIESIIPSEIIKFFFKHSVVEKEITKKNLMSVHFRAIPYNTLLGSGIIPAFKPEKIIIQKGQKELEKDAFLAVCKGKLLGENYQALVGTDILE